MSQNDFIPTKPISSEKKDTLKKNLIKFIIAFMVGLLFLSVGFLIKAIKDSSDTLNDINEQNKTPDNSKEIIDNPTFPPTEPPILPTTPPPTEPPTFPPLGPTDPPSSEPTDPPTLPPLAFVSPYCGKNTVEFNGECVYFPENGSNTLSELVGDYITTNKILKTNNGLVVREKPLLNIPVDKNTKPEWFINWENKGGYNVFKGLGSKIYCECGDCAGWRGGNAGSCAGKNIKGRGRNNSRRVGCNKENNECECAYPYTPLNGLCVNPYKYDPNSDPLERPCCPSCVYDNTCFGEYECDGICEEQLVEYPGISYECDNLDLDKDNVSYDLTTQDFNSKNCRVSADEVFHGMNEYRCVYECDESQINCSKRCLPKVWKWLPLNKDGELMGYIRTNKLIQFEPDSFEILYCPIGDKTCENRNTITENNTENCENCTNCNWNLNPIVNEWEYNCENCENCKINKATGTEEIDSVTYRTFTKIECSNLTECRGCSEVINPKNTISKTISCSNCKSNTNNCTVKNESDETQNNYKLYNKGGNYQPNKIDIWDEWYSISNFFVASRCEEQTGTSTCEGGTGGGILDGGRINFFSGFTGRDCKGKESCGVYRTEPKINDSNLTVCYGGKYYDQINSDLQCQKLPLPEYTIPDDPNLSIKDFVEYGVAKGLSKDECKGYFCNKWDWDNNKWIPSSKDECNAICEPDVFKNFTYIPEFATSGEQIKYLTQSGNIGYCFGGRTLSEISGDCTDINTLPRPSPGTTSQDPNQCDTTPSGSCNDTKCELYRGTDGQCSCKSGDCIQNGLCLSQDDNKLIRYGIAKGLPEWQCPYYYCQVYDREKEKWVSGTEKGAIQACAAICLPEEFKGYQSIPVGSNTEQQVNYMIPKNLGGDISEYLIKEKPSDCSSGGEGSDCVIL